MDSIAAVTTRQVGGHEAVPMSPIYINGVTVQP